MIEPAFNHSAFGIYTQIKRVHMLGSLLFLEYRTIKKPLHLK